MTVPQLSYWVANWNLSRAQASRLLGGNVVDVADCTGTSVDRVIRAYPAIERFAAYITGSGGIEWTAEQLLQAEHLGGGNVVVLLIDQSPRVSADLHIKRVIGDSEPGAESVLQAVETWALRHAAGLDFVIYCDQSHLTAIEDEVARHGLPHGTIRAYQWASPTSNPGTPLPGTSETLRSANADLSVFEAGFLPLPHVPPPDRFETGEVLLSVTYDRDTERWTGALGPFHSVK